MNKITNGGKGVTGKPIDGDHENELDNFITCEVCGQSVDLRDLGQVIHHTDRPHEPIDHDA